MALIKCPECGKEISDQAMSCPSCGRPLEKTQGSMKETTPHTAQVVNMSNMANEKPKKKGHGCLTAFLVGVLVLLLLILVIAMYGTKEAEKYAEEQGLTPTTAAASKENDEITSKEDAKKLDEEVWTKVIEVIDINNTMMELMNGYAAGTVSELDFYDYCKDSGDYLGSLSTKFPYIKDENIKPYIDSCKGYTVYVQIVAKSLVKYIDDPQTKNLSSVKENIGLAQQSLSVLAGNRGVFLTNMGFTEEEVQEIVDQIDEQLGETEAAE